MFLEHKLMSILDPWRLRTLRELALRRTMAAVAKELSLTPSAVSQQLANLERETGVQLIEPDGRGVRLTVAGQRLASHAESILSAIQAASDEVSALERDAAGPLRLAAFPTAAATLCPSVMRRLVERFPRHDVSLLDLEPAGSTTALMRGEVDLALVYALALPQAGLDTGVEHEELLSDPLYFLMPKDHPAARLKAIDLYDMREERWIFEDPTSTFYALVVELCHRAGFQPTAVANCRSFEVVAALVRAGCGVSIQPGLGIRGERDVVFRPLNPPVSRRIYAVYRKGSGGRPSIATALALFHEVAATVMARPPQQSRRAREGNSRRNRLVP